MSVSGGVLSVAVMGVFLAVSRRSKDGTGILLMSVLGGVSHNIGQLAAASVFTGSIMTFSYLPVLVISGVISGAFTGTVFRLILPHIMIKGKCLRKATPKNSDIKLTRKSNAQK